MKPGSELSEYRRDGFAVLKDAIPKALLDAMFAEIRDVFRPILKRHNIEGADDSGPDFDDALTALFQKDMHSYLGAAKATQLTPALHALGTNELVVNIAKGLGLKQPLIAVRPVTHILSDRLAVPGGYHRTPPHQDWRSVQGSLDALVVWLPLVPVDSSFGALEIIPGSHFNGLLATRRDPFGNVIDEGVLDTENFVPIEADVGDAVVFSMFTVHRTGQEQRPGIRWAVSFRYNNAAAPDYAGHDYPNPFAYKSQDDLLFEDFPSVDAVRAVFSGA